MELVPAQRIDITGLGWADYRRAPATEPATPMKQLLAHAARAAGHPVRAEELLLSTQDALELELRTKEFTWTFTRGATAQRLWAWWMKENRPRVSLKLKRGEAEVEARGEVAEKKSKARQRRVNKPEQ